MAATREQRISAAQTAYDTARRDVSTYLKQGGKMSAPGYQKRMQVVTDTWLRLRKALGTKS